MYLCCVCGSVSICVLLVFVCVCQHAHLLLKMMACIASKYEQHRSPSRDVLHAALQKLSLLVQARLLHVRPNPFLQESGKDVTIVCPQVVVTWHKAHGICLGNVPRLHDHHVQLLAELPPGAWRDALCMQDHFWQLCELQAARIHVAPHLHALPSIFHQNQGVDPFGIADCFLAVK